MRIAAASSRFRDDGYGRFITRTIPLEGFVLLLHPVYFMPRQPLKQTDSRSDFSVEVLADDSELLAECMDGDSLARIEFEFLDHGVGNGGHIAGLVAEFEHRGPLSHAAKPAEGAEVVVAFGIVFRGAAGVFAE